MSDWIGWLATGLFASSYLCKDPARLRLVQAAAGVMWMAYGVLIAAPPVIVANAVVASLALFSSWTSVGDAAAPARTRRDQG
jgi:uncharacterized protein with PQ loop repeat